MDKDEFEQKLTTLIVEGLKSETTLLDMVSVLEYEKMALIIMLFRDVP